MLEDVLADKTPIGCKWVYEFKDKADTLDKHKTRLVVKGFSQQDEINIFRCKSLAD